MSEKPSNKKTMQDSAAKPAGFQFTPDAFKGLVQETLASAKAMGAVDAVAEVSEAYGLSV